MPGEAVKKPEKMSDIEGELLAKFTSSPQRLVLSKSWIRWPQKM